MARILVADDAMFIRKTLQVCLEKNGHQVIGEAGNGIEAINQYKLLKPDVVMMDITMPELNGIEAIRAICGFDPEANIVVCSAMGQKEIVMEAMKAGAKDFIVKPFKEETIITSVNNALL